MTEKQYAPTKIEKNTQNKKVKSVAKQKSKINKKEITKTEEKIQETEIKEIPKEEKNIEIKENKKEEKKVETKKVKKDFVFVDSRNLPISTKHAMAVCKFIAHKPIQKAIKELEEVTKLRKAVPMKGEIPHRKGKMMSGRFPVKASENFIKILKGLQGNANQHDVDEPIIKEAIANLAQRPYGRFGRIKRKRSHVKIIAYEKSLLKNKKLKEKFKKIK